MKCKFCQGEMEPGTIVCPHCGKDNAQEQAAKPEQMNKTKLALTIAAIAAVALLGVGLILFTLFNIRADRDGRVEETAATVIDPETTPEPTEYVPGEGILQYQSYSVSDEEAIAHGDAMVAMAGDKTLTNRQLQMYYWMQFYEVWDYYYSQYGGYTPYYINLDYTQPFRDQSIPDGSMNWEQYLLEMSLNTWHRYQVLSLLAEQEGYTVTDEIRQELQNTRTSLEETAKEAGFESLDEMIQDEMGPGVTYQDYEDYMTLYLLGQEYFTDLYEGVQVTDADLEKYYTDNLETFESSSITKDDGNVADVRHILIMPEGGTEGEDGYTVYTDEEWADCLAEAQEVLDLWRSGEATEASFIAMTGEYTEDSGYAYNGGLYTDIISASNYMEAFEQWALSDDRKPGDCELVKTPYGYHIMYLVNTETAWVRFAREGYKSQHCSDLIDNAVAENPMEISYDKIAIGEVDFE